MFLYNRWHEFKPKVQDAKRNIQVGNYIKVAKEEKYFVVIGRIF